MLPITFEVVKKNLREKLERKLERPLKTTIRSLDYRNFRAVSEITCPVAS
jgi:hypothetical protein